MDSANIRRGPQVDGSKVQALAQVTISGTCPIFEKAADPHSHSLRINLIG